MTKQIWTEKHNKLWNKIKLWIILHYQYAGCETCNNYRHSSHYQPHCFYRWTKSRKPIGFPIYIWHIKERHDSTMSSKKPQKKESVDYDVDYICEKFFEKNK